MLERARKNVDAAKPVDRLTYAFCDYNTGHIWGDEHAADGKMPVMTYAGFGSEAAWQKRNKLDSFKLSNFDYIICDEMQNMVSVFCISFMHPYIRPLRRIRMHSGV